MQYLILFSKQLSLPGRCYPHFADEEIETLRLRNSSKVTLLVIVMYNKEKNSISKEKHRLKRYSRRQWGKKT